MNGENRPTLGTRIREFFRDSTQLGPVLLALVVGLAGGAGAILFRFLIAQSRELFFGGSEWLLPQAGDYRVIALPALGLLAVTAIVRRWAREAQGHGVPEVQYAVRQRGGRMRPRVAAVKSAARWEARWGACSACARTRSSCCSPAVRLPVSGARSMRRSPASCSPWR
jgi:hypothetical protein